MSGGSIALRAALCGAMVVAAGAATTAAEDAGPLTFTGTIRLAPEAAGAIRQGDRLILKVYHPGDGVEMDPMYSIMTDYSLPMSFRISPPIDMNGRARWPDYVVEAFTDNDRDVLSVAPGELHASSGEALPLGTGGVVLELAPRQP